MYQFLFSVQRITVQISFNTAENSCTEKGFKKLKICVLCMDIQKSLQGLLFSMQGIVVQIFSLVENLCTERVYKKLQIFSAWIPCTGIKSLHGFPAPV